MSKIKKNYIISGILILIAIIYTVLVKIIDVKDIGPNESLVGLSTLNAFFHNLTGESKLWYNITEYLAIIPLSMALIYAIIGLKQLIKRKSLFKVDKELLSLGLFYIIIIGIYIFFEIFIINYRPVLMEGELEASYPSSHTLIALCICASSIILNKIKYSKFPITKIINPIALITMIILVVGRILSGVHWLSDILGGIIISSALIMTYYSYLINLKEASKWTCFFI